MKKILIIGSVASGKTTLAKSLAQKTSIPWYELDCIVYNQTDKGRQKFGIEKCHYKVSREMLKMMYKWTWDFERNRDMLESKLELYSTKVIRIYHNKELGV